MNQSVICELCGDANITIIGDSLGRCEGCGAYVNLDDYDDQAVSLEKMYQKAELEEPNDRLSDK